MGLILLDQIKKVILRCSDKIKSNENQFNLEIRKVVVCVWEGDGKYMIHQPHLQPY